jgi:hypothetical protein
MGLLDIRLPNASADVVAVFDQNFRQVFSGARPMKAEVKETAKLMEHPVETGVTITDHRIIDPIEIQILFHVGTDQYRSIYEEIKKYFNNATLLTVQTRTSNYANMLIQELPHGEVPEVFDAIVMNLSFKEVLFVEAQFSTLPAKKVANPANASTKDRGQLNGVALNAGQPAQVPESTWLWRQTH